MLRLARADDASTVARVLQESRAQAMPWLPVVHDADDVLHWVTTVLLATRRVVVAERDGEVVGVCARHGTELEQLYVAPAAQGSGIGRTLLEEAKGAGRLQLWAFTRNSRARSFYAAAGFVQTGATDGADNEEHEPDVRLEWPGPGTLPG